MFLIDETIDHLRDFAGESTMVSLSRDACGTLRVIRLHSTPSAMPHEAILPPAVLDQSGGYSSFVSESGQSEHPNEADMTKVRVSSTSRFGPQEF
jgi:hypothetical protein